MRPYHLLATLFAVACLLLDAALAGQCPPFPAPQAALLLGLVMAQSGCLAVWLAWGECRLSRLTVTAAGLTVLAALCEPITSRGDWNQWLYVLGLNGLLVALPAGLARIAARWLAVLIIPANRGCRRGRLHHDVAPMLGICLLAAAPTALQRLDCPDRFQLEMTVYGAGFAAVSLTACWLAIGTIRWPVRLLIGLVVVAGAALLIGQLYGSFWSLALALGTEALVVLAAASVLRLGGWQVCGPKPPGASLPDRSWHQGPCVVASEAARSAAAAPLLLDLVPGDGRSGTC